jgi:hypothetical protein
MEGGAAPKSYSDGRGRRGYSAGGASGAPRLAFSPQSRDSVSDPSAVRFSWVATLPAWLLLGVRCCGSLRSNLQ